VFTRLFSPEYVHASCGLFWSFKLQEEEEEVCKSPIPVANPVNLLDMDFFPRYHPFRGKLRKSSPIN